MKSASGTVWESDIKQVNRCLETYYLGKEAPDLNVAFFDIEVDFCNERGFAPPDDPFNYITAISVYCQWSDQLITLAIPPKSMALDIAEGIAAKFENTFIFTDEGQMLETFLDIIEDADVLSGWNSEGFDIPYTVNRIARVLSNADNKRWCLWGQSPVKRKYERFGAESTTYDLIGRVHLDYMQLYRKYTYHEMHSYSLDTIGDHEVNETKIAYEGTLDQLYNQDFEKFIAYNRQDTYLLHKIDLKLDYISLASSIAHENTEVLAKTLGAVAVTEQGIINETHKLGFIVPNKKRHSAGDITQAAGAYVAKPMVGLHEWIGSIDINSLYPSVLRALNMAPETIIGQVRQTATTKMLLDHIDAAKSNSFASAWEGHFCSLEYQWVMDRRKDIEVTIDWEAKCGGELAELGESTMSAADAYALIFEGDMPWTMSANGTIFNYTKKGIIPGLLERWYADRKVMQATLGRFYDLSHGITLPDGFGTVAAFEPGSKKLRDFDFNRMDEIFEAGDADALVSLLSQYNVGVHDGKIEANDKAEMTLSLNYWDKLQLVRKISLNSLYGALLNAHCRFFDHRLGQSTTLTGRAIARHMDAFTNECITGEYDHVGESIIYGDTDSVDKDSMIRAIMAGTDKNVSIEELFLMGDRYWQDGDKEYSANKNISIAHTSDNSTLSSVGYNYVYRHKVTKARYKIRTAAGKEVIVTEDHSIMVLVDGELIEKKPDELRKGDQVISLVSKPEIDYIEEVTKLDDFDDEYVYDIGVQSDDPYFFANDLLVHNSVYFSAYPALKESIDAGDMEWDCDVATGLYDAISDQCNTSFPAFMQKAFHCPSELGSIIKGGREITASKGLFITKKRYAALVIDNEGERQDVDGKPGKLKAMGLDLKRSDTPIVVQDFLKEILLDLLTDADKNDIFEKIKAFKNDFHKKLAWEKGSPKRVNNLTKYTREFEKTGKCRVGHVLAAINYNILRKLNNDNHTMSITDGQKVLVCKLKSNPSGMTRVAIPIDEDKIPKWFADLPFDDLGMETAVVNKKIDNLLGVLKWDLDEMTDTRSTYGNLFG